MVASNQSGLCARGLVASVLALASRTEDVEPATPAPVAPARAEATARDPYQNSASRFGVVP
ncbi:MAG: hypothetical protein WBN29_02680, partial [Polyangiales bacterium]